VFFPTDKKCFECPLCKKEIGNVFGQLVKDNSQTSNYERVFKCNICYKTFPRQYSLKRHLMFVHPVKNDDDDENDCSSLLRKKLLDGECKRLYTVFVTATV